MICYVTSIHGQTPPTVQSTIQENEPARRNMEFKFGDRRPKRKSDEDIISIMFKKILHSLGPLSEFIEPVLTPIVTLIVSVGKRIINVIEGLGA
ncbi:uncharacterized protein LOC123301022 isoform X3 [Chrysoperla carnea]|nr:uncharacterized protein LOC123301022 isoform X3 [Chrysoperla carnea]